MATRVAVNSGAVRMLLEQMGRRASAVRVSFSNALALALTTNAAVDQLADQICMPVLTGALLDHVHIDPPDRAHRRGHI